MTESIYTKEIVPPHLLTELEKHRQLERIATSLGARASQMAARAAVDQAAQEQMISEGGPMNDNEQGENDD